MEQQQQGGIGAMLRRNNKSALVCDVGDGIYLTCVGRDDGDGSGPTDGRQSNTHRWR